MSSSRSQTATTLATSGIFWISSTWPSAIFPQPTMATLRVISIARLRRLVLPEERHLRGREARDGDAEGRAGDVVEAHLAEEADRRGIAAVLAADPELDLRALRAAAERGHLDERADAHRVE